MCAGVQAGIPAKIALVPGGDPLPNELLALSEAKLFELKDLTLLDRTDINKVLAEQKLTGMFDANNAVELGRILKADIFAVLETTSIVIFDAQTGLRFVDETLPEKIEDAVQTVFNAVKTAVEKREKLDKGNLVTFGVLEVRNVDFPVSRDAWCRAVAGMLERSLLHRGGAVLERSRLQHVNRERALTDDGSNDLLASMKLVNLTFTRGTAADTFKLTARIGNDTFYAESSFDKPLDAVRGLAEQLLESNVEQRRINEAARFAEESLYFLNINELAAAIEKMEVAVALEPENVNYKERLCTMLMNRARTHLVMTSVGFVLQPQETDAETMRQCVQDFWRIEAIVDTFPPGHRTREANDRTGFRHQLIEHARKFYPEYKDELEALALQRNRRDLNSWFTNTYRPALNRTVDLESFQRNMRTLMTLAPRTGVLSDTISLDAEVVENALRLSRQYGLRVENPTNRQLDNDIYRFYDLLERFASIALGARLNNVAETDPTTAAVIEQILVMLEQDSRLPPQIYAWIARNRPVPSVRAIMQGTTPAQRNEYFQKVKAYLASLPKNIDFRDSEILYDQLFIIIETSLGIDTQIFRNFTSVIQITEALELADSRDEFAFQTLHQYIYAASAVRRNSNDILLRSRLPDYRQLQEQFDPVIPRQLALGERLTQEAVVNKRGISLGNTAADLRSYALRTGVIERTETPAADVADRFWKSEVTLLPIADGYTKNTMPSDVPKIRGNRLFLTLYKTERTNRFVGCVDLDTLETQYIPFPPNAGLLHICKDNLYFRIFSETNSQLLIYPHDGSESRFASLEGLPGTHLRIIGSLDNKCYAAVDEDWVFRLDLETLEWEQLSSSRAKEGNTPFIDGIQIKKFEVLYDVVREHIILHCLEYHHPETGRFFSGKSWTIEKDGKFLPLVIRKGNISPHSILAVADGGQSLLFRYGNTMYLYDFDSVEITSLTGASSSLRECVWKGYIWSSGGFAGNASREEGWAWNRRELSPPRKIETLATPEAILTSFENKTGRWYHPTCVMALPNDKGLIVMGCGEIVLLRFE